MNKVHALKWLVDNVSAWPVKKTGIVSAPDGWLWGAFYDGSVQLYKKIPTEMYADCHIKESEWFNAEADELNAVIEESIKSNVIVGKKIKIYIAGPMTGYEYFNRPAFNVANIELSAKGNIVLNHVLID